jgi:hypothetical protein
MSGGGARTDAPSQSYNVCLRYEDQGKENKNIDSARTKNNQAYSSLVFATSSAFPNLCLWCFRHLLRTN